MSDEAAGALKRLQREWDEIKPIDGIEFTLGKNELGEDDFFNWTVTVTGPETYLVGDAMRPCPYAGVKFPVSFSFSPDYPFKPPVMKFAPGMLLHPNVSNDGIICMDLVKEMFVSPAKVVRDWAALIVRLLSQPTNIEHTCVPETATMMRDDIEKYERIAKEMASGSGKK